MGTLIDNREIGLDILQYFYSNKDNKSVYRNPALTDFVINHHSTKDFVKKIKLIISRNIRSNFSELKELKSDKRAEFMNLNENIIKEIQDNVHLPIFNDMVFLTRLYDKIVTEGKYEETKEDIINKKSIDFINGGSILIDSVHSVEIEVKELRYNKSTEKISKISYKLHNYMEYIINNDFNGVLEGFNKLKKERIWFENRPPKRRQEQRENFIKNLIKIKR